MERIKPIFRKYRGKTFYTAFVGERNIVPVLALCQIKRNYIWYVIPNVEINATLYEDQKDFNEIIEAFSEQHNIDFWDFVPDLYEASVIADYENKDTKFAPGEAKLYYANKELPDTYKIICKNIVVPITVDEDEVVSGGIKYIAYQASSALSFTYHNYKVIEIAKDDIEQVIKDKFYNVKIVGKIYGYVHTINNAVLQKIKMWLNSKEKNEIWNVVPKRESAYYHGGATLERFVATAIHETKKYHIIWAPELNRIPIVNIDGVNDRVDLYTNDYTSIKDSYGEPNEIWIDTNDIIYFDGTLYRAELRHIIDDYFIIMDMTGVD